MAAIVSILFRRVPATQVESCALGTIVTFCAAGLLVSLLLASYGVDLSPSFF
jgi:hypothetical protein